MRRMDVCDFRSMALSRLHGSKNLEYQFYTTYSMACYVQDSLSEFVKLRLHSKETLFFKSDTFVSRPITLRKLFRASSGFGLWISPSSTSCSNEGSSLTIYKFTGKNY
jgi:hypothetical protein